MYPSQHDLLRHALNICNQQVGIFTVNRGFPRRSQQHLPPYRTLENAPIPCSGKSGSTPHLQIQLQSFANRRSFYYEWLSAMIGRHLHLCRCHGNHASTSMACWIKFILQSSLSEWWELVQLPTYPGIQIPVVNWTENLKGIYAL